MRKSIFCSNIFITVLLFVLFEPDYCKTEPLLDTLYLLFEIVAMAIVSVKYLSLKLKNRVTYWIFAFYLPMIFATIVRGNDLFYCLKKIAPSILLSMIFEICLYYKGKRFLLLLAKVITFLLVVNVVTFIPYPNGMVASMANTMNDKIYFLSNKNGMISWVLPPALIYLNEYYDKKCKRTQLDLFLIMVLGSISIFYTGSSTGIIGWTMFIGFIIIKKFRIYKMITFKRVVIVGILLFFLVNIFRIQHSFMRLFDFFFGEKVTFTGREWIWDQAILKISQSWLFGYGIAEKTQIITDYGRYYSAHNFVLDSLLSGGVICMSIFVLFIINIIKKNKHSFREPGFYVWVIGIFIFFVCTLTETPIMNMKWWIPFLLIYYSTVTVHNLQVQVQHPIVKNCLP